MTCGTGIIAISYRTFLMFISNYLRYISHLPTVAAFTLTQHTSTFTVSGGRQLFEGTETMITKGETITFSLNTSMFAEVEKQYVAITPPSSPEPPSSVVSMSFTRR